MSLQVWLPLTKDLRNQGSSSVTATNSGTTYSSTGGKLGGYYKTSSTSSINTGFNGNQINTGSISFGGWFKFNQSEISSAISGKTYTSSATSATGNLIGNNSYGGISLQWSSNNMYASGSFSSIGVQSYLRTSTNGARATSSFSLPFDTWTHIFLTYNKDTNVLSLWINGELKYTYNQVAFTDAVSRNLTINYAAIAGGNGPSAAIPFCINDIRIYDHCLSPMEVKELAKGLVLHYPLDRQGWGQDNVLLNTHFDSRYSQTTGWNTTKNGTLLANSWGGYNSGVTNQGAVYHAHLKEFNGEYVYEYIKTADESWLGISQGGLQSKLTAGKTYTFSWEEYHVSGANRVGTGLYYYKTGASSANFHLGIQQRGDVSITGKWQKCSYTFTAPSDMDTSKNASWYVYGHYNGNGTFYVRHLKLEEGSIVTPWIPATADILATTMDLNGTTEYDCSGFCNNGTRTGTFDWTSNTAKYAVSTKFNGTDNAIQTPSLPTMIADKNYTIAVWIYKTVIGSKGYQTIYGGPSGFEIEARNGSANETKFVPWNWGKPMASYELNEWNHCVFVHSDADCKIYLNGEYIATGTAKASNPTGNYFVGAWNTATQQNFDGLMSDFRIYATALSADDVKSLYQNSAYIDSSGNVYGKIHT